jgi:tripartite-type tricarboxylate transporter receptor subunit TctC
MGSRQTAVIWLFIRLVTLASTGIFAFGSAGAVFAADFYQGKTISILSGGAAGGGHDTHSRLLATYLGKYIPGNPTVVVQNMTSAGGITAANHMFNLAKRDGTELGEFLNGALFAPLRGEEAAKYKAEEFNWIGTPASFGSDAFLIVVRSALGYKTMDDVRKAKAPLNIANHGTMLIPLVKEALGANAKILPGYKSGEVLLLLERGELDGIGVSYFNLTRRNPEWLPKNFVQVIVQYVRPTRLPGLPDVPTAWELARTPDDLALIKLAELAFSLGYPFAAPPGVPEDRLVLLRKGFAATMEDPAYKAALEKAGLEYSPKYGEALLSDLREATKASPAVIAQYKRLSAEGN